MIYLFNFHIHLNIKLSNFLDITGYDCGGTAVLRVIKFIFTLLDLLLFLVPMMLIIMVSVDFMKNVISGKEEEMKKNLNLCIKRLIYAGVIFLIGPIVEIAMTLLGNLNLDYLSCIDIALYDDISQYKIEMSDDDFDVETPNFNNSQPYDVSGNGKVELTDEDYKHLDIYRQNGQYSSQVACNGNTVGATACGMSSYMAARYVLTKKDTDYMDFVHEACDTGFHNGNGGADWDVVANKTYEDKYGIKSVKMEKSYDTIVEELEKGNVVVVLDHAGYATVDSGGFNGTSNGHFIAIINYNKENGKVYVFNPTGQNTGWTSKEIVNNFIVKHAQIMRSIQRVS